MAEDETNQSSGTGESGTDGMILVTIPEEQAAAVLEFVASLRRDESSEVSGHMISRGISGGIGGSLAYQTPTYTKCVDTKNRDMRYGDTDSHETIVG